MTTEHDKLPEPEFIDPDGGARYWGERQVRQYADARVAADCAQRGAQEPDRALIERLKSLCAGVLTYYVMNEDRSAFVMSFDVVNDINPKRLADAWLAQHQADFPERFAGYQVVAEQAQSEKDRLATAMCQEVPPSASSSRQREPTARSWSVATPHSRRRSTTSALPCRRR